MNDLIPTESLIRFLHATPEQRQAIDRFLLGIPGNSLAGPRPTPACDITPPPRRPQYSLRKDCGVWHLVFEGKEAYIKHERGLFYVVWLLYNPPEEPIHALDLMAKIPEIYRHQLGLPEIVEPATGKTVALPSHARLQERSLALDDAQSLRALYRKQKELETILDSDDSSEPEKAEALRELEAIAEFQRRNLPRTETTTQRVTRAVRMSIKRLHRNLATTLSRNGEPHPVLHAFAIHLQKHILLPSARYSGHGGPHARTGLAGRFTYEPPQGTTWLT